MGRIERSADLLRRVRDAGRHIREEVGEDFGRAFLDEQIRYTTASMYQQPYKSRFAPRRIPSRADRDFYFAVMDGSRLNVWERSGTLLDVDPDAWKELGRLKPKQKVWTHTFRNIRTPDPFIRLPEPLRLIDTVNDGDYVLVEGFILTGYHTEPDGDRLPRSLTASDVNGVALNFVGFVFDGEDRPVMIRDRYGRSLKLQQANWQTVSVDIQPEPQTLDEIIQRAVERFRVVQPSDLGYSEWLDRITELLSRTLGLLMYLGSSKVAIEESVSPAQAKSLKRTKKKSDKPAKRATRTYKVGFRIGASIRLRNERRAQEEREEREAGISTGTRKKPKSYWMPPLVRAYHCGARACTCLVINTDIHIETRFIEGYYAATQQLHDDTAPAEIVVRPVKK